MRFLLVVAFALVVVARSAPISDVDAVVPESELADLTSCNVPRDSTTASCTYKTIVFNILFPSHCTSSAPCGIIVNSHGVTMNADAQEHAMLIEHDVQTNSEKFIVITPEDANAHWEFSVDTSTAGHDDVHIQTFIRTFIHTNSAVVDTDHVHSTGFSMGGMMTTALMLTASDLFCSASIVGSPPNLEIFVVPGLAPPNGQYRPPLPWTHVQGMLNQMGMLNHLGGSIIKRSFMFHTGTTDPFFSGRAANMVANSVTMLKSFFGIPSSDEGSTVDNGPGVTWKRYSDSHGHVIESAEYDFLGANAGHCVPVANQAHAEGERCGPTSNGQKSQYSFGTKTIEFFKAHPCSEGSTGTSRM